ncbi:hypothetical protein QR680_001283 [Steinernema hermaphroditum]|uniref:Phenylalanyl-tRNA synthetase domain-containing protein n=1 Tax=Steinernema hermaphroditum TaxID=289476 RepID=A0AA39GXN2_9BILA|nr:hypothetical protein QR680_001283 [Steinernema hermaphroditum]
MALRVLFDDVANVVWFSSLLEFPASDEVFYFSDRPDCVPLDTTHLAEFHQVEGVIAERNPSLSHAMRLFKSFFSKMGFDELRFKSAYNPHTEPSMEIFAYHKG